MPEADLLHCPLDTTLTLEVTTAISFPQTIRTFRQCAAGHKWVVDIDRKTSRIDMKQRLDDSIPPPSVT